MIGVLGAMGVRDNRSRTTIAPDDFVDLHRVSDDDRGGQNDRIPFEDGPRRLPFVGRVNEGSEVERRNDRDVGQVSRDIVRSSLTVDAPAGIAYTVIMLAPVAVDNGLPQGC